MKTSDSTPSLSWWAGAVAVLGLATGVRLSAPGTHFHAGRLVPVDADAAMHTRRALAWIEQFPWPPLHDPFLGFPEGAIFPWSPGWDAALGLFAWILGGGGTSGLGFQVGLALFPLVVGVLTVAVVLRGARRLFGERAAVVAGLVVALAPQHVAATQWGRPDHSGAEGLFLAGLLLALATERPCRRRVALWTAGACLVWVGGFLYAVLAAAALTLSQLPRPTETGRIGLTGIALGAVLAMPIAAATGLQAGGPLDYARLSLFHPLAVVGAAAGGAWLLAWRSGAAPKRQVGIGVVLLAGAVLLASAARTGLEDWLTRGDPWLATVTEMQPMWEGGLLVGGMRSIRLLGLGVVLLPFCWIHLARTERDSPTRVLLWGTAGCLALVVIQNRFGWTLAPLMGVVIGASLARLTRLAPVLAVALFLRSPAEAHAAWMAPKARENRSPWVFDAYRWLATTDPVDATHPEWGVLGTWRHGHWINVLGERPSAIGHFGTYAGGIPRYHATQAMWEGTVEDLLGQMDAGRYRYVLVSADELDDVPGPLGRLLFGGSAGGELPAVPGLNPVYASPDPDGMVSKELPGVWVYERVPGARLEGTALPGGRVEFLLPVFWMNQWRSWRTETRADASGQWTLQIPLWTGDTGGVQSRETAFVKVEGAEPMGIEISQAAVRQGLSVAVPAP
jgi:hypothetical protein